MLLVGQGTTVKGAELTALESEVFNLSTGYIYLF